MDDKNFDKLIESLKNLTWQDSIDRGEHALKFMYANDMLTEEQWKLCANMLYNHNLRMDFVRTGGANGVSPITSTPAELDRALWKPRGPSSTT